MVLRLISVIDFLFFQVGSSEVATRSKRAMKRNFRALVKESGTQVVCFFILPVAGNDEGTISSWLQA